MSLMYSCIDGSYRAMLYRLDMLLRAEEDRTPHANKQVDHHACHGYQQ